jgi:hypothetical protein
MACSHMVRSAGNREVRNSTRHTIATRSTSEAHSPGRRSPRLTPEIARAGLRVAVTLTWGPIAKPLVGPRLP